jgi:hypothetical protein
MISPLEYARYILLLYLSNTSSLYLFTINFLKITFDVLSKVTFDVFFTSDVLSKVISDVFTYKLSNIIIDVLVLVFSN